VLKLRLNRASDIRTHDMDMDMTSVIPCIVAAAATTNDE